MSELTVRMDERVRLVTAVLAAGDWPQMEQAQERHAVHPHAKQTQHFVRPFAEHVAVRQADQLLAAGVSLEALFSAARRCSWPDFDVVGSLPPGKNIDAWPAALAAFARDTGIVARHWQPHRAVWQEAVDDLSHIFAAGTLVSVLQRLRSAPIAQTLQVMPTLVVPMLTPVLATTASTCLLLLPPPKAVGESPPWPYREDPAWVVTRVSEQFVGYLLADEWATFSERERVVRLRAAVSVCLTELFDEMEGMAYLVRSKKAYNLPELPAAAERLTEQLQQSDAPVDWRLG